MNKKALITGITGQDGSYLAELLLEKDSSNKWRKWVNNDFDPFKNKKELIMICGHYIFSTNEFNKLKTSVKNIDNLIQEKIYLKIKNMI